MKHLFRTAGERGRILPLTSRTYKLKVQRTPPWNKDLRIPTTVFEQLEQELRAADETRLKALEARYQPAAEKGESEACYVLGGVALSRGDLAVAEALLRRAAGQDPGEQAILAALGEVLAARGCLVEAEAILQAVAQARPADYWAQFWLGRTLAGMGRPGAAEAALRKAAGLAPNNPAVQAQLGHVLGRRGDADNARLCLAKALKLNPDMGTRLTVLDYLARLGDMDEAVEAYRKLLDSEPGNVRALYNLAFKAPGSLRDNERRKLEETVQGDDASRKLSDAQRAAVHYALAGVVGDESELAVSHARAANAAMLESHLADDVGYVPEDHRQLVDGVIETFDGAWFSRTRGWGSDSLLPVFIVGMPRSGTSLVEQILASHPRVVGGGELAVVNLSLERLPLLMQARELTQCLKHVSSREVAGSARFCLDSFEDLGGGATRVTDKFPDNYLHLGWIRTLFPNAAIIHCQRDARDTAISCWLNRLPEVLWSCDLEHITTRIEEYLRVMAHWRNVLPGRFFNLSYEALVAQPEQEGQRLVEHCGLEWDPACLRFYETRRTVETASYRQVRKPVYRGSAGRWESYREVLEPWLARLDKQAS